MRTFIVAVKRCPELPVEEFQDRWATAGAKRAGELAGLRRYVRSIPLESAYARGREPAFDAVAEVGFDTDPAADPAEPVPDPARPAGLASLADLAGPADLADPSRTVILPVAEVPIIAGAPAPVKVVSFVRRRPDLTPAQFQAYWRDVHAPIGARNPYLRRYVQWHVHPAALGGPDVAFDGVGMVWFDSLAELRASASTPDAAEVAADGPRFAAGGVPAATLVVAETVVLS